MTPTPAPPAPVQDAKIWDWPLQTPESEISVRDQSDKFEMQLDVHYFKPEEIDIQVAGGEILIHCKHEKKQDDDREVAREILRAYHLPKDVDIDSLKSNVTPGRLQITAAKKQ